MSTAHDPIRGRFSYANVMSTLSFFLVVAGGTAIAAKVGTGKIAPQAVTSPKIADGAVGTNKLADGAVGTNKLGEGAVATGNIAHGAVTASKIASGVIPEIPPAPVIPSSLPPNGPAGGALAGAYPNPGLANGAVTTVNIAGGAVTDQSIQQDAVTQAKIAPNAVGGNQLKGFFDRKTGLTLAPNETREVFVECALPNGAPDQAIAPTWSLPDDGSVVITTAEPALNLNTRTWRFVVHNSTGVQQSAAVGMACLA